MIFLKRGINKTGINPENNIGKGTLKDKPRIMPSTQLRLKMMRNILFLPEANLVSG